MRVIWTEAAVRTIRHAHDYLQDFNASVARHLADALLVAGDSLEQFPLRGRMIQGTHLRELPVAPPYMLRYRIDGGDVIILRLRHNVRRSGR